MRKAMNCVGVPLSMFALALALAILVGPASGVLGLRAPQEPTFGEPTCDIFEVDEIGIGVIPGPAQEIDLNEDVEVFLGLPRPPGPPQGGPAAVHIGDVEITTTDDNPGGFDNFTQVFAVPLGAMGGNQRVIESVYIGTLEVEGETGVDKFVVTLSQENGATLDSPAALPVAQQCLVVFSEIFFTELNGQEQTDFTLILGDFIGGGGLPRDENFLDRDFLESKYEFGPVTPFSGTVIEVAQVTMQNLAPVAPGGATAFGGGFGKQIMCEVD